MHLFQNWIRSEHDLLPTLFHPHCNDGLKVEWRDSHRVDVQKNPDDPNLIALPVVTSP